MQERKYSICPFCGLGCGFYLTTANDEVTGVDYAMDHPFNEGALCSKGNTSFEVIQRHDRLFEPIMRIENDFKAVSWEDALATIASRLKEIKEKHGAQSIGVFASAKATNEENYLLQKFARLGVERFGKKMFQPEVQQLLVGAQRDGRHLSEPPGEVRHAAVELCVREDPRDNAPFQRLARRHLFAQQQDFARPSHPDVARQPVRRTRHRIDRAACP